MNNLQIFDSPEFGQIRTIQQDGQIWFVGKDVATALGYSNSRKALADHVKDNHKNTVTIRDGIGNPNKTIIDEAGVYSLVMRSKLPQAEAFQEWVVGEVLPAIRQTGAYMDVRHMTREQLFDVLINPEFLGALTDLLTSYHKEMMFKEARKEAQIFAVRAKEQVIAELKPAKEYLDTILAGNGDMTISQIAADFGMKGAELNEILKGAKVQYKINGQWLLTKAFMNKGLTHSTTTCVQRPDGENKIIIVTRWTQKGRLFIYQMLKELGYKPVNEM